MRSLDTNLLLRLVLGDDPGRAHTVETALSSESAHSFIVADAVLFEMAWVLSSPRYGYSREMIGEALAQIMGIPQIRCNRELIKRAVPLYIAHPKLSFIDVCLTVYAEFDNAVPLLTFDRNLAKTVPNAQLLA